jgi:hypothetical protein
MRVPPDGRRPKHDHGFPSFVRVPPNPNGPDAANGKGNQDHAEAVEKHGKPGKWNKVSMPSELLPRHHIFYERRIIDVLDGLPKWRHLENTEEMGEKDR